MPRRLLILPVMFLVLCAAKFAPELEVWTGPAINAGTKILDSDSTQLTVAPSLTVIDGTGSEPTWTVLPQIISQRNTSGTHDAAIAILSGAVGGKSILLFSTSASYADGLIQVDPQNDKMEFFLNGAEELEISGATATFSDALVAATIDTGQGAFEINGSLTPSNLIGTANQIVLSGSGVGALANGANVTLSLPQDIATDSDITFGSIALSDLTGTRLVYSDGSKVLTSVADLSSWIAGTTSQITVTSDGDGTLTLSTPQSISSGSSPTFAGLTISNDLSVANGGTGVSTFTDGGVLLGSGAADITVTAVLGDGEILVGDGAGDPAIESGATARTSLGLGTSSAVEFGALVVDSIDTGQGVTEVFAMNQAVTNSSSPAFVAIDLTDDLSVDDGGTGASSLDDVVGTTNEIEVTAGADTVIGGDVTIGLTDDVTVDGITLNDLTASRLVYSNPSKVLSSVTDLSGWVGGTASQVTVTTDGDGTLTLSTPQNISSTSGPTFATVNTGEGANELFDMDQDVQSDDAVTFVTVNTGQGANELYDMNQDVQTTDDVTFSSLTISGATIDGGGSGGDITIQGDNDIILHIDHDNSLTSPRKMIVKGGDGTAVVEIDEDGDLQIDGDATLDGAVDLGNAASDYVTITGQIDADILPYTSNAPGLGDASTYWTDAYITDLFVGDDLTMGTTDRLILDDTAGDGPVFMSHARLEQASANGWYNVLTYTFHATDAAVSIFWILTVWTAGHDRAVYKGLDLFYNLGGTEYKQSGWADFVIENNTSFSYAVAVTSYGLRVAAYVDESDDTTFDLWYVITESEE